LLVDLALVVLKQEASMLSTFSTLGATQAGRTASLPRRVQETPVRTAILESIRQRNALLDAMFYDVKLVGEDEAVAISPWLAAEGAILLVPPSGASPLRLCTSIDDFIAHGGPDVRALVVAGVGSSALGSAAFARNVADATGQTVAAVVSGYGLADVAAEAMGGFFLFGAFNSIRHTFEPLDRATEVTVVEEPGTLEWTGGEFPGTSRDTLSVIALLENRALRFDRLIGHSKGNLVISEALYQLRSSDPQRAVELGNAMQIVTISARIAMPPICKNVIDVMGEWDWFGGLNSRPTLRPTSWCRRPGTTPTPSFHSTCR
jgi:hypothetical protein